MKTISLADLNLIARSLPPFATNDRTGDQRVAVYVYRGHAWIETNGDPAGLGDVGAGALADECGVTLDEVETARAASETNAALTGHEAIAYAREYGLDLTKLADPTEEACVVTVDEAIEIAKEDPALLSVEAPTWTPERMVATHAAVGNDGRRPVVWGLGTSPEMAFADALRQDGFDEADAPFLRIESANAEVQRRVQHGDVAWSDIHPADAASIAEDEAHNLELQREAEREERAQRAAGVDQ